MNMHNTPPKWGKFATPAIYTVWTLYTDGQMGSNDPSTDIDDAVDCYADQMGQTDVVQDCIVWMLDTTSSQDHARPVLVNVTAQVNTRLLGRCRDRGFAIPHYLATE
tara:strand:- start:422 stop:742 length:321 start_codon:yes stop_codon:yes gene_type:complete